MVLAKQFVYGMNVERRENMFDVIVVDGPPGTVATPTNSCTVHRAYETEYRVWLVKGIFTYEELVRYVECPGMQDISALMTVFVAKKEAVSSLSNLPIGPRRIEQREYLNWLV